MWNVTSFSSHVYSYSVYLTPSWVSLIIGMECGLKQWNGINWKFIHMLHRIKAHIMYKFNGQKPVVYSMGLNIDWLDKIFLWHVIFMSCLAFM